jgi:molybdate transport system substrate-binding protein
MRFLACLTLLLAAFAPAAAAPPLVLAAASLQEAMTDAANAWAAKGHDRPVISFAASSALARQIQAGAPADLFVSADLDWMDAVAKAGLIRPETRVDFLRNRLALIGPAGAKPVAIGRGLPLARMLGPTQSGARLSLADPGAVPAGRYAREALTKLGLWEGVADRLARGENVRAALALVERGEAPLGIVYATDARASGKVALIGLFPAHSHAPIVYPMARLTASTSADAEPFRRFLLSREARAIFARRGFIAR